MAFIGRCSGGFFHQICTCNTCVHCWRVLLLINGKLVNRKRIVSWISQKRKMRHSIMIKTDMKAPVQLAPYVVVKNEADHRLSVHSDACDRQQAPYVYVLKRGKTARVVMDLIFVKDADRFNQDEVFIEKMLDACEQAAGDAAYGTFLPGLYTMLNRVPVENA